MRFTIQTGMIAAALGSVTRALSSRTTNPILDGILIEAGNGSVRLTCTDERITIIARLDADVEEAGRGVVPGKLFGDLIRRMPEGELSVSMTDSFQFRIQCQSSRMNLSGQDADLFPLPAVMETDREITLPQHMLRDMIAKTEFAIAAEDMREVLTGCLLEVRGGDVIMVALDGFRMAMVKNVCSDMESNMSAIIPGRAAGDIGKLLSDEEDAFCTLSFEQNRLHITMNDLDIYAVLVEGEYIDYRRILPTQFKTRIRCAVEPLRRCVDRAALIAREGSSNLVRFRFEEGTMYIESNSEIGDVHEEMEVDQEGSDLTISFNVKYLIDVMRSVSSEEIEMSFNSSVTPCVIVPVDERDYLHMVLPVRTQA